MPAPDRSTSGFASRARSSRGRRSELGLILLVAIGALAPMSLAVAQPANLFRPLLADPRENLFRTKHVRYTEDWRYGTDITDSTSTGGVVRDRTGVYWDVGIGETYRLRPSKRIFGRAGWPWIRYQLGLPIGVFANLDRWGGELINSDYQFGGSIDLLWTGEYDDRLGIPSFDRPVVTSRSMIYHRSTHLGDEYLSFGRFGRNQDGHPDESSLFEHPPVKRVDLRYEAFRSILSAEWAPSFWNAGRSTIRGYAGGEIKFPISAIVPENFTSPIGELGLEIRSSANQDDPADGFVTRALNALFRGSSVETEWIAAVDLKLAKPYDFASCDNPNGEGEVWTPHLWTECEHGDEFDSYAGSWHAMIGLSIFEGSGRRVDAREDGSEGATGHRLAPEIVLALDWYRGYSPNGQFLDQRLRYRPAGCVLPSITAHF